MVLLIIKIEFKEDLLNAELSNLDGILGSIEERDGYQSHSVNVGLKEKEQLLLIVEWKNEAVVKNYLQTEEFQLLVERINKVGTKYSCELAGVLSRGRLESIKEQTSSPPILEPFYK